MSVNANEATADRTSLLLDQLRLQRESQPQAAAAPTTPRRWKTWVAIAGAAVVVALIVQLGRASIPKPEQVSQAPVAEKAGAVVASGVSTSAPLPDEGGSMLDASGYVVALRQATVSAKTTGRVDAILIEEGQRVKQGDVIARLDDSNARAAVVQAQAQLEQAEAGLGAAKTALDDALPIFQRNERQHAVAVISAQDFDKARAAYDATLTDYTFKQRMVSVAKANLSVALRTLDDTIVRAPFSGVVTVKAAQPGEIVSPISAGGGFTRTGVGTIVDMDSLAVEVDVGESYINRVRPGQPATVKLNAYPDWTIPASVAAVIPTAERSKATVKVRIAFATRDARVLPEMGARVSFMNSKTKE